MLLLHLLFLSMRKQGVACIQIHFQWLPKCRQLGLCTRHTMLGDVACNSNSCYKIWKKCNFRKNHKKSPKHFETVHHVEWININQYALVVLVEKNCIWFLWKNFPLDHADCFSCKNQNYWLALGSAEILIFSGSAAITYYCWLVLKSIPPNHLQVEPR